jgi:hypothetical protein
MIILSLKDPIHNLNGDDSPRKLLRKEYSFPSLNSPTRVKTLLRAAYNRRSSSGSSDGQAQSYSGPFSTTFLDRTRESTTFDSIFLLTLCEYSTRLYKKLQNTAIHKKPQRLYGDGKIS